jgi:hypothetical protein
MRRFICNQLQLDLERLNSKVCCLSRFPYYALARVSDITTSVLMNLFKLIHCVANKYFRRLNSGGETRKAFLYGLWCFLRDHKQVQKIILNHTLDPCLLSKKVQEYFLNRETGC